MNQSQDRQNAMAPGHSANQGQMGQAASPSSPGKEEHHQATREHAPTDQEWRSAAEGNPADPEREERIRRRAYQLWEAGGRQEGQAEDHWHRAAQDLDREDAELQRSGSAGKSVSRT